MLSKYYCFKVDLRLPILKHKITPNNSLNEGRGNMFNLLLNIPVVIGYCCNRILSISVGERAVRAVDLGQL